MLLPGQNLGRKAHPATPVRAGAAGNCKEATLADGFRGRTPKTDERRSTSYENRSRLSLTPIIAPVSLHKFCFTVSDTLEGVDANTFDTCTLYNDANEDHFVVSHYV